MTGTEGDDSASSADRANDTIYGLAAMTRSTAASASTACVGGPGDDLYYVNDPADIVVEQQNEGIDEVRSTASYTRAGLGQQPHAARPRRQWYPATSLTTSSSAMPRATLSPVATHDTLDGVPERHTDGGPWRGHLRV